MKKIKILALSLILCLTTGISFSGLKKVSADTPSYGTAEIVMEVGSKRVLFGNNIHDKKYMASTTKILTAIVIIENCDLSETVTVTDKTVGVEGSSIYLQAGEKLTVKELLYGLMLRSGNDCAETLAVYCSGSIEKFAELMNQTAARIGATESHFVNPHGLHDDMHYTTAYDLALISCYAIRNENFKEIVSSKTADISFSTQNYRRHLINKNKMLKEFEGSDGIKTGYTKKAGRCLVSSCERNGMHLVCVVLNCPPMFERSKSLLTDCFERYERCKIAESDNIVDFIKIGDTERTCGVYLKEDVILPLTEDEKNALKTVYELPSVITEPKKKDSLIGFIRIYSGNNLIFEEKLFTIIDVEITEGK